jgi:hypothetical protein
MDRLEVSLEDGPHGLVQARSLHTVGERDDRHHRNGIMLWNVTLTLRVLAPDSWWHQARQYFPEVLWLRADDSGGDEKRMIRQEDFETDVPEGYLAHLNELIASGSREALQAQLPESFLRSGIVQTNMETILTILHERRHYQTGHWAIFCQTISGMESLAPLIAAG